MLNGGGEKIKWKLEMIYNARKNHESGLYGDKLTFLNLIYQGWDRDVLFWCIIMGRQVSEMRGEMLKYVPKKVLYIYFIEPIHTCACWPEETRCWSLLELKGVRIVDITGPLSEAADIL